MLLPAITYGPYKEVRPRMRGIIKELARGASLAEAVKADQMLDTRDLPGYLVLEGPSPLIGGSPHFQCYLPLRYVYEAILERKLPRELTERVFQECLATDWGTLLFLCYENGLWMNTPGQYRMLVEAAVRSWNLFEAEGARYTNGLDEGKSLWDSNTCVHMALARLGIPNDRLNEPLPAGGLAELAAGIPAEGATT